LDRVLPTALMLVNERGLSMAGLDRASFQLAPPAPGRPGPAALTEVPAEPLGARARRVLREEGLSAAAAKAAGLARHRLRRLRQSMTRRLARWRPGGGDGVVVWPSVAASQYVAISEFAHALDRLQAKRCWLQERRRASDEQLLPLFVDPFFANYDEARY